MFISKLPVFLEVYIREGVFWYNAKWRGKARQVGPLGCRWWWWGGKGLSGQRGDPPALVSSMLKHLGHMPPIAITQGQGVPKVDQLRCPLETMFAVLLGTHLSPYLVPIHGLELNFHNIFSSNLIFSGCKSQF